MKGPGTWGRKPGKSRPPITDPRPPPSPCLPSDLPRPSLGPRSPRDEGRGPSLDPEVSGSEGRDRGAEDGFLGTRGRVSLVIPKRAVRVLIALVLVAAGCVERALVVESDPPGARVWVNGMDAGETPARVRFQHYGRYRIVLRKPGFEKREEVERVRTPWYQYFPIDFFAEFIWPGKVVDERRLRYELNRAAQVDADALVERAREKLKALPPPAKAGATARGR